MVQERYGLLKTKIILFLASLFFPFLCTAEISSKELNCLTVAIYNPEPKVVSVNYRNVYPCGDVSGLFLTRKGADNVSNPNRVAVIESLSFDDGTEKVNYIEV